MKNFNECNGFEQRGIIENLKELGFGITVYHPENEKGMSKDKIGFMLKNLIIDGD